MEGGDLITFIGLLWQLLAAQGLHEKVTPQQQPAVIIRQIEKIDPPKMRIVLPKQKPKQEAHPPPKKRPKPQPQPKQQQQAPKPQPRPIHPIQRPNPAQIFTVTAYTAGYESTQKHRGEPGYGRTASGAYVRQGVTAACPPSMPFGTRVNIQGIGDRICQDRGGAITEGHLDVYFDSLGDARAFGNRRLQVTVKR